VALAAVLFLTCMARAESIVAFSYTFQDKTTITGTVEGDLQPGGDLVTGLRNLNAVYSGRPNTPLTFVAPPGFGQPFNTLFLSGTQVFGFFGFATDPSSSSVSSNFGFGIFNEPNITNAVTVGTFGTSFDSILPPFVPDALEAEIFRLSSYSASVIATVVPEPSSVALAGTSLGLLLGYHVCRRVSRKAAAR